MDDPRRAGTETIYICTPGALLFNAPRPMFGDETWNGDFIVGRWYGLVRPDSPRRDINIRLNLRDDGTVLRLITMAEAEAEVRAYYAATPGLAKFLALYDEKPEIWRTHWMGAWENYCAWDKVDIEVDA